MKQNAKNEVPFTLNSHFLERVKAWENLVLGINQINAYK